MQWVCTAPELKRFTSQAHFLNMSLLLLWNPPAMKVQWSGNFQSINDVCNLYRQLIQCSGLSTQNYNLEVLMFETTDITNTLRIYNLNDYRKLSKMWRLSRQAYVHTLLKNQWQRAVSSSSFMRVAQYIRRYEQICSNRKYVLSRCFLSYTMSWISLPFHLLLTHMHCRIANDNMDVTRQCIGKLFHLLFVKHSVFKKNHSQKMYKDMNFMQCKPSLRVNRFEFHTKIDEYYTDMKEN
jgi:hypothetical protein